MLDAYVFPRCSQAPVNHHAWMMRKWSSSFSLRFIPMDQTSNPKAMITGFWCHG